MEDPRGNLSFVQNGSGGCLPFVPARVHWIYDVPGGRVRHGHGYRRNMEFIVALSGSFDVAVRGQDGAEETFHLSRGYYGLYVGPNTWRELRNFSTNSVAMVINSEPYDPDDYVY